MSEIALFRQRLAEAIAWCRSLPTGSSLWSIEVRDPTESEQANPAYYLHCKDSGIVSRAVRARAALLERAGITPADVTPDLCGGRLLSFFPEDTLFDGAAAFESGALFDDDNIPAWDTWVHLVFDEFGQHVTAHLLCWVPPFCLDRAARGIHVDPAQCIAWTADVDSRFTAALREAGLLR